MTSNRYTEAGVDIDRGNRAVELMKDAVRSTYGPEVLSDTGSFGGLYDISALKQLSSPVLVASTDSVGTKTSVAARLNRWDTIGQDIVNHCVNDILVQGARPLFFLDYVASSHIEPEQIAAIVGGAAQACKVAGCALIGGETAEMPGVYQRSELDLVGTVVGLLDRPALIDGSRIQQGDAILALPSTGLHTNGFSLARLVLGDLDWETSHPALGGSIGDALLAVHRCYLREVQALQKAEIDIRGLAHITGGGLIENLPRILPEGLGAVIQYNSWPRPPIFGLIQALGDIDSLEMFRVFNMGLGMLVVIPPEQVAAAQASLPDDCFAVGQIVAEAAGVRIEGL